MSLSLPAPLILKELVRRKSSRFNLPDFLERIQDKRFPEQDAFVKDQSQFLSALCTRRAGKSNGLALRFFRTMARFPGSECRYIALTHDSARSIMWPILEELDERFKIGLNFVESRLTVGMKNGSTLRLVGADTKNFIKRLKGVKCPGVAIDEAQDFNAHIESLVDDVLTPTISDYGKKGWLAVTGTPGPVPYGFFYEVTEHGRDDFSGHKWTLYQNPYFPDPHGFVERLIKKKKWAQDNPTLLREWRGLWVLDMDAMVFKYHAGRNHFDKLPEAKVKWEHVIGVDIGFRDKDAIAVIAWSPSVEGAYLVEEFSAPKQDVTDLANVIKRYMRQYNPMRIVVDAGSLGAKIAEELRRRHSIPADAAEKSRKFEYIELLNDAMRTGRFSAKSDGLFAQDCLKVKWDQDALDRKVSDNYHSDICDAVLYGFREALHWLHEPEPEAPPEPHTPAWYKAQEDEMRERAREMVRQKKRQDEDPWGWG